MREENTLATWFSSILFFIAAIAFILLGWGQSLTYQPAWWQRNLFRLSVLGCVMLSADEVGSFHEAVGLWFDRASGLFDGLVIRGIGYSWLLLIAPLMLLMFGAITYALQRSLTTITTPHTRHFAQILLWFAMLFLPSVFLLEGIEAYWHFLSGSFQHPDMFITVIEEVFEVVGMYCLFLSVLWLVRTHDL